MTKAEMQLKLAVFDGWQQKWQNMGGGDLFNEKPNTHCWVVWVPPLDWRAENKHIDIEYAQPPDYPNDLNAIHKIEKKLTRGQLYQYMLNMQNVEGLSGNNHWLNFIASAEQRSTALIRTLDL
jgi:hypothetical protein